MMKKLGGCLFAGCTALLLWLYVLYGHLDGQIQARFSAQPEKASLASAMSQWNEASLEYGLYAMGIGVVEDLEDVLLYECLAYHPDALGITMVWGAPITPAQITNQDHVVMLSQETAMKLNPAMDWSGRCVQIDGESYQVVGVYRARSHLGFLTQVCKETAILPCRAGPTPRNFSLWLCTRGDSRYLFQRAQGWLDALHQSADFASSSTWDLGLSALLGRQGILLWLWLDSMASFIFMLRRWRQRRARFLEQVHRCFSIWEAGTCLRGILPRFVVDLLPSVLLVSAGLWATVRLAGGLVLNEMVLPQHFLRVGAWLEMFAVKTMQANAAPWFPVYPYVLCMRLSQLSGISGALSFALMLLFLKEER